jgi:hypothetical protein
VDGDGANEIVFNQAWSVTIVDGNGQQLTSPRFPANDRPIYLTDGTLLNTPAVADLNQDGRLELIVQNSKLYVWELPQSTTKSAWPMFKHNPARTANSTPAYLRVLPNPVWALVESNAGTVQLPISVRSVGGEAVFEWRAEAATAPTARLPQTAGTATTEATIIVEVSTNGLKLGTNQLGTVEISATINGEPIAGSPASVPLVVVTAETIFTTYLPGVVR